MISKEKPKFDPNVHQSYKAYIDQYYALDYEDMIGDQPCRFKYRNVMPNDYGLSVDEILMADDKELNRWCSLKKALEHKSENQELNEVRIFRQKAQNEEYKRKILQSLYKPLEEEEDAASINGDNQEGEDKKKRRRKKKKSSEVSAVPVADKVETAESGETKKENKKRKADNVETQADEKEEPETKKIKTKNAEENNESNQNAEKKKKRKKKNVQGNHNQSNNSGQNNDVKKEKTRKEKRKEKFQALQKAKNLAKDPVASMSDERLKAYGINPKSFKNKLKYGKPK